MSERGYYTERYRLWRDTDADRDQRGYVLEDITTGKYFVIAFGHVSVVAEMLLRAANDRWLTEYGQVHTTDD